MIHLYTNKASENQNISTNFTKNDNDNRIIKSSEMAVCVTSGNNFMSLYSNPSGMSGDDVLNNPDAINFDLKNNLDYMTVMSNTMSSEDFNKMMDEGFRPGDMDEAESVNTLDRIKAKMAESGMVIEGFNDDLSEEVLEEALGSSQAARAIKDEFSKRDLAVNSDNIEKIAEEFNKAKEIEEITDGMCDYILRNALEPTVDNLYRVRFCAAEVPFSEGGYFSDEYGHIVKDGDSDMTESEYFNGKIKEIASELDIEDPDEINELVEEGRWLVKSRILCNKSNLSVLHDLRALKLPMSDEDIAKVLANATERGEGVSKAELTKRDNLLERAVNAKEVVDKATDSDIQELINQGRVFNIDNLASVAGSSTRTLNEGMEDPKLIANRRILEETRLRMSVEANYMMLKRGMSLETTALEETVNVLKALEEKVSLEYFGSDEVNASEKASLWKESRQVIAELPYIPAKAIGDITKSSGMFTLRLTYEVGVSLKETFERAQQTYESVGTEVRGDLGDSIKKAFANVDDIIKDNGLEVDENTRKAVRILGYSEMEINAESIMDISAKESMLNRIINKMTPSTTLELIREGVNPLETDMEELERKIDEMDLKSERASENYASFLCRLDKAGNISEDERQSYIGIYRLLDKIEKSDGKALGDVVKTGVDINFKNILTALRTGKSKGLDFKVDSAFGEALNSAGYEFDISDQIGTAFEQILKDESGNEEYFRREFEEYKASLANDEKDVASELEYFGEKVTSENLRAMEQLLTEDRDYNPWKKMEEFSEKIEDNSFKENMAKLAESFEDPETVRKAYDSVLDEARSAIERISESGLDTYSDVKAIKTAFKQIGFISRMTREENYEVPVVTEDDAFNIRIKITHKSEREGKVFTSFETEKTGKILGQFLVRDGALSALVAGDNAVGLEKLKSEIPLEEAFANTGFEEVTFNYIQTDIINVDYFRQHFDGEKSDEVTTKQLYNIAKTFIETIRKAGK